MSADGGEFGHVELGFFVFFFHAPAMGQLFLALVKVAWLIAF
jgi:hypothetical protein